MSAEARLQGRAFWYGHAALSFLVGLLGSATMGPIGWAVGLGALVQISVLVALAVFVRRTARGDDGARVMALRLLLVSTSLRALQWTGLALAVVVGFFE